MYRAILHSFITSLFVFTLVSCGGGGSAGIGGTGITSGGTITGFGSIFVNGIEYDTDAAVVSGDLMNVSDLKLGMVVTVRGQLNSGTTTGKAESIVVDIELKGAITTATVLDPKTNTKSFTVLGRNVIVSDSETVFDGISNFAFDNIAINDVVEVSGYLDASGNLQASRAEKKGTLSLGNTEIEINGTYVRALSAVSFELMVGGNTLTINNPNALTVPGGFSSGLRLEVEGIQSTNTEIEATSIELDEDAISASDDEVEIEGLITNYVSNANFTVNGQQVNASQASLNPSNLILADNVKVEVEGNLLNGILVAEKVEARSGAIEVKANVSSVDTVNKTITLTINGQDITFSTNNQTKLEDDDQEIEPFTLSDINNNDYLIIKAYDDNGTYIATDVKRKEDALDAEIKIEGMVSAIDTSTPGQETVTILGVTYPTDNMTIFKIDDGSKTRTEFFTALQSGDTVELEDQKSNGMLDGIADELDLKN